MAKQSKGQQRLKKATNFEKIVEKIYQMLSPRATVKQNDKINGRQIDVSVRAPIPGGEALTIIEVKDHKSPVNVTKVDQLHSVMIDTAASKGFVICNKGFTEGAKAKAKKLGIELCSIHDAENKDWTSELTFPILLEEISPEICLNSSFEVYLEGGTEINTDAIFNVSGISIIEKFTTEWNAGLLNLNEDFFTYNLHS